MKGQATVLLPRSSFIVIRRSLRLAEVPVASPTLTADLVFTTVVEIMLVSKTLPGTHSATPVIHERVKPRRHL